VGPVASAFAALCAVALAILAPHMGVPVFLYPLLGIGLCAMALRLRRWDWQRIGWSRATWRWPELGIGAVAGVAWGLANFTVFGPALAALTGRLPDFGDFAFARQGLAGLGVAVLASILVGGLYEETIFRGALFHLVRWRRGPLAALVAFATTSAAFALYHAQLGLFGIANAFLLCLPLGCLQWRYDGRAASLVGFHACSDIVAFVLLYAGAMPGG
jgi:membrane protease YdiL (CAAX protease family)